MPTPPGAPAADQPLPGWSAAAADPELIDEMPAGQPFCSDVDGLLTEVRAAWAQVLGAGRAR